ncbi:hypothetical protein EMIT0P44_20340 [Pseudomonas sp. IT-P44]
MSGTPGCPDRQQAGSYGIGVFIDRVSDACLVGAGLPAMAVCLAHRVARIAGKPAPTGLG